MKTITALVGCVIAAGMLISACTAFADFSHDDYGSPKLAVAERCENPGTKERINQPPEFSALVAALNAAGSAHHEYEQTALNGVFDDHWSLFYAAFVLGRMGGFTTPSALVSWLTEVTTDGDWSNAAAKHIIDRLSKGR